MEKNNKTTLKSIYSDIRNLLFQMIPEKWESIYLYASVIVDKNRKESGEMYFYYYPKSVIKKNPINVYEVPAKFNINEEAYMAIAKDLYELIKKLRHECIKVDNTYWSNISISIENVEFLAEYNYDNLTNSDYTSEDRRNIWKYKYLNYPIEKLNRREKQVIKRYIQEEEWGQHGVTIYSETFYQKHVHNDVQYNMEYNDDEKRERYISKETKETKEIKQEQENKEKKTIKNQLLKN